jgi:hypothetical protein
MNRFPSADLMVMSILLDASRTSRSRAREDELVAMATPVVIDNPEFSCKRDDRNHHQKHHPLKLLPIRTRWR